jgi:hypothetical protein
MTLKLGTKVVFDEWINHKFNTRVLGRLVGEAHGIYKIEGDNGAVPNPESRYFYLTESHFEVLPLLDEFTEGVFGR